MASKRVELTEKEALQKRIEELSRSLELEKMRSRAFEKMIGYYRLCYPRILSPTPIRTPC